jgi:hypothetical protein
VGEQLIEAKTLSALGEIALATGADATATAHLRVAGRLFEELSSTLWHARTSMLLAQAQARSGDTTSARGALDHAERLLAEVDSKESARLLRELRTTRSALLGSAVAEVVDANSV